jgi:hypothetical protein
MKDSDQDVEEIVPPVLNQTRRIEWYSKNHSTSTFAVAAKEQSQAPDHWCWRW